MTSCVKICYITLCTKTAQKYHMVWLGEERGVEQGALQGTSVIY